MEWYIMENLLNENYIRRISESNDISFDNVKDMITKYTEQEDKPTTDIFEIISPSEDGVTLRNI
jgi:hypothetical protein